jgi:hypothetical protein
LAERGRFMQIASAEGRRASRGRFATEVAAFVEKASGMPLEQVHADQAPVACGALPR